MVRVQGPPRQLSTDELLAVNTARGECLRAGPKGRGHRRCSQIRFPQAAQLKPQVASSLLLVLTSRPLNMFPSEVRADQESGTSKLRFLFS